MTEKDLSAALRRRDEAAVAQVMQQYTRLLWTVAARALRDLAAPEDLEEIVADVFVYLWENPEKFDPERGRLKDWLSAIARSRAVDRRRQLIRRTALPLEENALTEELGLLDQLLAADARQKLARAVDALEEPDREIILRRYCRDEKPRAIARALGLNVKQVENRLYRAKAKLRTSIEL